MSHLLSDNTEYIQDTSPRSTFGAFVSNGGVLRLSESSPRVSEDVGIIQVEDSLLPDMHPARDMRTKVACAGCDDGQELENRTTYGEGKVLPESGSVPEQQVPTQHHLTVADYYFATRYSIAMYGPQAVGQMYDTSAIAPWPATSALSRVDVSNDLASMLPQADISWISAIHY